MKKLLLILVVLASVSCQSQRGIISSIISEKNGKVGIGTANPDELLTVKGKIHTREVLVDLNGAIAPDYVFETYFKGTSSLKSDYQLAPLLEVENYIKENHHLPKVPSAKELRETGMELKTMNLLLLEKIEELTLYTIRQQKEIDQLKEKIDGQE